MNPIFTPGEAIYAGNTAAVFVRYLGSPNGPADGQAIIRVGSDTRVVGAVSLRRAE